MTGVNIGDFGNGSNESFYDLIVNLDKIKGIQRFRISSIEPNLLSDEIMILCKIRKIHASFSYSLQSGSNKILSSMGRRYDKIQFSNRIKMIKSLIPDACIGVDVIVGFPSETEEDFMETFYLLDQLDISTCMYLLILKEKILRP